MDIRSAQPYLHADGARYTYMNKHRYTCISYRLRVDKDGSAYLILCACQCLRQLNEAGQGSTQGSVKGLVHM